MSKLVAVNPSPLMQPVQFNGQTYYTGQYFHQLYRSNSDADGKYKQTGTFLRLIRSIEAYSLYVESGDIVELTWEQVKDDSSNAEIALLIRSNSYKPIMLINATAQVALTHHLDDEVSKQASVAVNRQVARQRATDPLELQYKRAKVITSCSMSIFKMLGTDTPMARVLTVKRVSKEVGMDFSDGLIGNHVDEVPVNLTKLGEPYGLTNRQVGVLLADHGFREKNIDGKWVATEKGRAFSTNDPFQSPHSEHSGYQLLWYPRVMNEIMGKEDAA